MLIEAAFSRVRTVMLILGLMLLAGVLAYQSMPKEAAPDVAIPIMHVSMVHEGVSPEDAERLLLRPMEQRLRTLEGVREMRSVAAEGRASVTLEFGAGFDPDEALSEVREQVDLARSDLPPATREPVVREVNVALFPVLSVALSGAVPERRLVELARGLRDRIEGLPGVLEVEIGGDREEVIEAVVTPQTLEAYGLSFEALASSLERNNHLVAAGRIEGEAGSVAVKVPGVVESREDLLGLAVARDGARVVSLGEIAIVRRSFRDPEGFARIDGAQAVVLEVSKRVGANIIETVAAVREIVEAQRAHWGGAVDVTYLQDESDQIENMLDELEANVLTAVVLVMLVVALVLGGRSALTVGLAIPGAFLGGILVLHLMGVTVNLVVLFSLILVVGMLVDGAIVTTELAERNLAVGQDPGRAYAGAAKRMAWPVAAATATTLAVFVPLLSWPGVVGEFMSYLPITVIVTLSMSLLMALIFIPVTGSLLARAWGNAIPSGGGRREEPSWAWYRGLLGWALDRPVSVLAGALGLLVLAYVSYGSLGQGVTFFPSVEPEFAQVQVRARGNLSARERDAIVQEVEGALDGLEGTRSIYARSAAALGGESAAADVIGVLQVDFKAWDERAPAAEIIAEVRRRTARLPGIVVQVLEQQQGPASGRPVSIEVSGRDVQALGEAAGRVRALMEHRPGLVDIEDGRALPGVEWVLDVSRTRAARFGTDLTTLGQAVQLVTEGIVIGEYRPDDAEEEIEIRVRYPASQRGLDQLRELRVPTPAGAVPVGEFVEFRAEPRVGSIDRLEGRRVIRVEAGLAEGVLASTEVAGLKQALESLDLPEGVQVRFAGEEQDMQEASRFLLGAFVAAVALMFVVLLTQFNSIYQAGIILAAIVFSTAGVLLGLLATGRPFGVVMGGIGVIALAGIVVNNNIVLIDAYNAHRAAGLGPREAIMRSACERARPVLLTSVTTVLGLLPMVFTLSIDLLEARVQVGSPSTQWWAELSSAIAGGLSFATMLTLVLTPCLLMIGARAGERLRRAGARALPAGRGGQPSRSRMPSS